MPFSLIRIVYISTGLLHIGWYDINLWCAAAAAAAAAVDDTLMDAVNHQTPVTPRVLTSSLDDLDKPAIQELTGTYTPDTLVYTKSDEIASRSGRRVDVNASKIPQLIGDWQPGRRYRFPVAEAQGAMMGVNGDVFLLVSGFLNGFRLVTRKTYSLDTSKRIKRWIPRDRIPVRKGLTHAAFVVVNATKFFMCGGYVGGSPGPHTDVCLVFDMTKRRTRQWSSTTVPPLPGGGRAGGGMIYDKQLDALVFAAGAQRPNPNNRSITVDYNTTFMYSFANPNAGWVTKAPIPFRGNHLSFVTARDPATGKERHFFAGGQHEENEANGNSVDHYEYDVPNDFWIQRKNMTLARGHASSSTRAVGCGYIVAAGSTNGGVRTADVSFYDMTTDVWTSIGTVPSAINTPVCDIARGGDDKSGVLHCESGFDNKWFSWKIQITY